MGKKRRDTSLEAVGAEHLVLAHLLLEGIPAYKAYDRTGGYDLVAVNPSKNRSVRIQVKSRWATDYDKGYPFGDSYGSDFAGIPGTGYLIPRAPADGGKT